MSWIKQRTSQLILLFLAVLAGTVLGSTGRALYPDWGIWENPTFCQGIGIVTDSIFPSVFWLAVTAAFGLSVTGIAGTPCVLLLRGAALGAVLEQIYASEGFRGFLKVILFIMPYAGSATLVMLFGAREALRFSMQIAGLLCEKTPEDAVSVKLYIIRFLVLFGFLLVLGFLQSCLLKYGYPVFSKIF